MIKALSSFIIIKEAKGANITPSGLYLPSANKVVSCTGVVSAVGEAVKGIKVGDEVVYRPYAAAELTVAKEEYTVIEQADIIGIVEK